MFSIFYAEKERRGIHTFFLNIYNLKSVLTFYIFAIHLQQAFLKDWLYDFSPSLAQSYIERHSFLKYLIEVKLQVLLSSKCILVDKSLLHGILPCNHQQHQLGFLCHKQNSLIGEHQAFSSVAHKESQGIIKAL